MPYAFLAQADLLPRLRSFYERVADRPWTALIELVLIGAVIYAILRFLHGTRGARLVRAIIIIFGASFAVVRLVAEQLEFTRIKVLYPYFVFAIFLVSLVAFQTELRRLLMRLGETDWLGKFVKGEERLEVIDHLVRAGEKLSKKKIGALIAIERTTEIGAVADSGVHVDALITVELLETIFWPGSALHDLGVIIRQGRIVAAGCQFPLAESGDIDRALGSRHRAALGMSHEADSVVMVVSEETGAISLAIRGNMYRALSLKGLRERLLRELAPEQRHKASAEATEANENADDEKATGQKPSTTDTSSTTTTAGTAKREGAKDGASQVA